MESGEVSIQPAEKTKSLRLPTTWEFRARLWRLGHEREVPRPPVPDSPTAIDLAQYGQVDWEHIDRKFRPEGKSLPSYLHGLARLMMTREGYLGTNHDGQPVDHHTTSLHVADDSSTRHIEVRNDWGIAWDGNHRLLILRLLGPEFVKQSGMDQWVKVKKI